MLSMESQLLHWNYHGNHCNTPGCYTCKWTPHFSQCKPVFNLCVLGFVLSFCDLGFFLLGFHRLILHPGFQGLALWPGFHPLISSVGFCCPPREWSTLFAGIRNHSAISQEKKSIHSATHYLDAFCIDSAFFNVKHTNQWLCQTAKLFSSWLLKIWSKKLLCASYVSIRVTRLVADLTNFRPWVTLMYILKY